MSGTHAEWWMYEPRVVRQRVVHDFCVRAFGADHASSVEQRAVRMLEESIEAYQAASGTAEMAHRLIDYIFAKPTGSLVQELGGVGVTVLALAHAAGLNADAAEVAEIERVLSKPPEWFTARNAAKNAAGFDVTGAYPSHRGTEGNGS